MKLFVWLLVFSVALLNGQILINGFETKLSGPEIDYHSPHPDATHALISRATDGKMEIRWQTAPLPETESAEGYRLIWLAGLGCNLGVEPFTFKINQDSILTFKTWNEALWRVQGKNGITLQFNALMVDKYGDRMGLLELIIPEKNPWAGKKLTLSITGQAAGSQAWVMVYTFPIKSDVRVEMVPALVKKGGKQFQPLQVTYIHLDKETPLHIKIDDHFYTVVAKYGINQFEFFLPPVSKQIKHRLILTSKQKQFIKTFLQKPVRKWTVYLVQHTHTDIGYTRPQQEILAEHLRYIDYALDYCDLTDSLPDEAKFRWTCEASWPVREYLLSRPPEQINRLKKRISEGRIELTAMLFNMSELADENLLTALLQPLQVIQAFGLPVQTAMQNDVNGFAWALLDYFPELGIKYVTMGENTHRALKPFSYPTPFWWKTKSGNKVLAFRADHYMAANFVANQAGDLKSVEKDLFAYLKKLKTSGYPFDVVEMQHSGYFTDNAPPSTFASEMVKKWNEKYEYPRLRTATISDFMKYIEQTIGSELSTFKQAWPDWWTDGAGSAARETAVQRQAQDDLIIAQSLLSMARLLGATIPKTMISDLNTIAENLLFWTEHTYGAAESITDPLSNNSINQWMIKASFAWKAQWQTYLLKQKALGLLQPYLNRSQWPTIYVFNTLNWKRSGMVTLYIDKQLLPADKSFRLLDEQGKSLPMQRVKQRAEGNYWTFWVNDVPPLGYKALTLQVMQKTLRPENPKIDPVLENKFYRVELDAQTGTVKHLLDHQLGCDLVDHNASWELGTFIYERLSDRHAMELYQAGNPQRVGLKNVRLLKRQNHPLWNSLTVQGTSPAAIEGYPVQIEIRLFNFEKRIDFIYTLRKKRVFAPEAIYMAFPFNVPQGKIYYETQGAVIQAGVEQLPGTATDWNAVQSFAAVKNKAFQVVLSSVDCPLMQFGNINIGRYQYQATPEHPHIYAWPLNNYWTTNFKASQEGDLTWRFSLTSSPDTSNTWATRFGWQIKVPLSATVLPPGKTTFEQPPTRTLSFLDEPNLVLIQLKPIKNSNFVLAMIRETAGKSVTIDVPSDFTLFKSDVLGSKGKRISVIEMKPYAIQFLLIRN